MTLREMEPYFALIAQDGRLIALHTPDADMDIIGCELVNNPHSMLIHVKDLHELFAAMYR